MKGAVEMILGVRDRFVWAGEAHAKDLALLELALVLRLVAGSGRSTYSLLLGDWDISKLFR